jgi:hypothetical protein
VRGGRVIGVFNKIGGHPKSDLQIVVDRAATICDAVSNPAPAAWHGNLVRPHHLYRGKQNAALV